MRHSVSTDQAPAAIGPYSQGILGQGLLFVSGQTPLDPATGKLVEGSIGEQAVQCLKNMQAIVEAGGASLETVAKVTVFLTDMRDFAAVNEEYKKFFSGIAPARSCVAVRGLPLGAQVEIEAIAFVAR